MSNYSPDLWQIVRIKVDDQQIDKIMGSWYGGYADSDSWRLSSGITKIVENDSYYAIHNHSGSIYRCYKDKQGVSRFTEDELENIKKQLEHLGGSLEVIDISQVEKLA